MYLPLKYEIFCLAVLTLRGLRAWVACKPKLLRSTTGVKEELYSLCRTSTSNIVGILCFCRSNSYSFRYVISSKKKGTCCEKFLTIDELFLTLLLWFKPALCFYFFYSWLKYFTVIKTKLNKWTFKTGTIFSCNRLN